MRKILRGALFFALPALLLFTAIAISGCKSEPHDYTDKTDNIVSVELIDVKEIANYEDELVWEPVRSYEKEAWSGILADAAELEYVFKFPSPVFWREGFALKVVFDEPVDGCEYVMYMHYSMVSAKRDGERIELWHDDYTCVSDQWEAFAAKYFGE